jgi:hypothetical protein
MSWPRMIVGAACAVVVVLYCANSDMGGDPDSPRGDGTYRPVLARGDGHMMYLMARSTALDGDWVFDNDLARFGDPWGQPRTKTGRKAIGHPIGPALVWTPLIWLAEGGAAIANLFGADIEMHGYTLWHQRFVFLSSALFACGAVLLGRRLAIRVVGGRWGPSYAAVAVLLGTPLFYYATYMPSYAHAMDSFACAAFLYYWATTIGRYDPKRWLVLGALLGVATLVRVQELAFGIVVALEVGVEVVRALRRRAAFDALEWAVGGAIALAAAVAVFVPQLLEWHLVFGSITELPQGAKYTRLEAPMVLEVLFSPRNGWFTTTPLAYAGVIGLFLVPRRNPVSEPAAGGWRSQAPDSRPASERNVGEPGDPKGHLVATGLVAVVAIQIYLNSTILDWWGSAAFGQRRMCNLTLPLVVGTCALIWRCGRLVARVKLPRSVWHGALVAILAVFVAWNMDKAIRLRGGKPAPSELSPSCCDNVPSPLRGIARWFYDRIGDPFEFPANAIYAVRHGVPLARWDETVGNYPLVPPLDTLLDDRLWKQRGAWRISGRGLDPYLIGPWSAPEVIAGRTARVTLGPSATLLVPNLMPYGQRLTLWLAPAGATHATVTWNGDTVADADLTGWTPLRFELPDIALHTNELAIECSIADGTKGIAVGDLELEFLPR